MDPCMKTSRVKQAISTVQLFVQRCLMNLESQVSPDAIDGEMWRSWLHGYRLWEANYRVFAYPENYVEYDLRLDKSPFFKELESELLQNDLNTETAETAFLNYLNKLDEVARLEICGMYVQDKDPETPEDVNIIHVFGRTFNVPHIYYYRRFEMEEGCAQGTWTPWEKVQVDIEGDHLIPVIWNRKLYIFWPIFTEKARTIEGFGADTPPQRYFEIKLAWSEYMSRKWSAKRCCPRNTASQRTRIQSSRLQ